MDEFGHDPILLRLEMTAQPKSTGLKAPTQINRTLKSFTFEVASPIKPTLENIDPQTDPKEFPVHTNPATSRKRKLDADNPSTTTTKKETTASGLATRKRVVGTRATTATTTTATARKPPRTAPTSTTVPAKKPVTTRTGSTTSTKPAASSASSSSVEGPPKKKRAAWDVKGRLQDLEEQYNVTENKLHESTGLITTMTDRLKDNQDTIQELMQFKHTLESTVQLKEREKSDIEKELEMMKQRQKTADLEHEMLITNIKNTHETTISDLNKELAEKRATLESTSMELTCAKQEIIQLKSTISTQTAANLSNEMENKLLKKKIEELESNLSDRDTSIQSLERRISELDLCKEGLESKLREEESIRRKLHNTIQELKGNIRVFCRVRPYLGDEANQEDPTGSDTAAKMSFGENQDENMIELTQFAENASGSKTISKSYPFSFDRVFRPGTQQTEVFEEISQLVQSALDGYNVCIFAYGQTGSGKTFTMQGPDNLSGPDDPQVGMIPRAVKQIFDQIVFLQPKGWSYKMECRYIEIYNETIRDLLGDGSSSKKHEIKHLQKGKTVVTDATTVEVMSPEHVFTALNKAAENRAVAATNCNERSSRSHSVFTLSLSGENTLTGESSEGILNLIDLAGSERLSQSGSTGDRLKETQAINKSLSSLGDVIFSLSNKDAHIPYRNSKLTYLLQNSLGGNSKTLMFVNVSPRSTDFQETICSLRFATKVNSCQIGTAKRQTNVSNAKN